MTKFKKYSIYVMVIGLLCAVIYLMIDPPPLSGNMLKDEVPEWNEFGLDTGHDIGSFVPIDQGIIKSVIATLAYLMDQLSESSFLNIKPRAICPEYSMMDMQCLIDDSAAGTLEKSDISQVRLKSGLSILDMECYCSGGGQSNYALGNIMAELEFKGIKSF